MSSVYLQEQKQRCENERCRLLHVGDSHAAQQAVQGVGARRPAGVDVMPVTQQHWRHRDERLEPGLLERLAVGEQDVEKVHPAEQLLGVHPEANQGVDAFGFGHLQGDVQRVFGFISIRAVGQQEPQGEGGVQHTGHVHVSSFGHRLWRPPAGGCLLRLLRAEDVEV